MSDEAKLTVSANGGSRPVPDPTLLTDRAIERATLAERDWVAGQLAVRDERLTGIDQATALRLSGITAIPGLIDAAVGHLSDLTDERFAAVERQRIEQKADTKAAVDAALSAAKEAVKEQTTASQLATSKSDAATASQLSQLQQTFTTDNSSLRRSLEEVKERENEDVRNLRVEIANVATLANGIAQQKAGAKEDRTAVYAAVGVGLAIAGYLAARGGI